MTTYYGFAMGLITQCAGSSATSELSAEDFVGIAELLRPVAIFVMPVVIGVTMNDAKQATTQRRHESTEMNPQRK